MKTKPRPNVRELLALNLKRRRAELGWSQDVLALEAGLDRTFVAHVERMKRNISLDNIEKLAAALSSPTASLLQANQTVRPAPSGLANPATRRKPKVKAGKAVRSASAGKSRASRA